MRQQGFEFRVGETTEQWKGRTEPAREAIRNLQVGSAEARSQIAALVRAPNDLSILTSYLHAVESSFIEQPIDTARSLSMLPAEQCQETSQESLSRTIDALGQATNAGIGTSRLLLPNSVEKPRGLVSFVKVRHAGSSGMTPEAIRVNADLFLLLHTLARHKNEPVFLEGPPQNQVNKIMSFQQDSTVFIPNTSIPLFSFQGQAHLCADRDALIGTIAERDKKRYGAFDQLFLHTQYPLCDGVESNQSYNHTIQQIQESAGIGALRPYEQLITRIFSQGHTIGATRQKPRRIFLSKIPGQMPQPPNVDWYPLDTLIEATEKYLHARKIWAAMHERREGEIVNRMRESVAKGKVPHVFFGASHTPGVLERCRKEGFAVLLTTPHSLNDEVDDGSTFADERNATFAFIRDRVLPEFRSWNA